MTSQTVRLTVAQAVVTYLSRQYSVADGQRRRLVPATLGIFGHGNVAGLGQALDQLSDTMPFIQGRNEQALVHAATAFAKHRRRHATLAVTSSIGPGALIIAGGGVIYSGATAELERLAGTAGLPVLETFAGKGAVQQRAWWQIGGIGLEGTPAANALAREADLVLTVGARLTDFATASHSLFANPAVRFASVNVNPRDADRLGATGIVADARQALAALADGAASAGIRAPGAWRARAEQLNGEWATARAAALDPDRPLDWAQAGPDVGTTTDAVL